MRRTTTTILIALMLLSAAAPAQADPAAQTVTGGYTPPPFGPTCEIHRFGEGERPPLSLWLHDPLCVEYSKRDITFDNGDALTFLLAEPSRLVLAGPACRYWQQDHWSVQVSEGATALVAWDGNYWFDKKLRTAAVHLANFRVNGHTAGVGDVVVALAPQFPQLAQALAAYGTEHGESGVSVALPYSLWCDLRL
ncbi:hypothetical protein ACFQO7_34010 [Catellatospora aurea]|uniref:Uncharacterized protein n=1 Tax=Catellatospora aurea TaxID=1337874 RepID=A0ABW2HA73_9ACTN